MKYKIQRSKSACLLQQPTVHPAISMSNAYRHTYIIYALNTVYINYIFVYMSNAYFSKDISLFVLKEYFTLLIFSDLVIAMSAKIVAIIDSTAPLGVAVTKTLCMYPEFEVRCLSSKRMHSDFNSVYYDVHDRHSIQSALNGAHAAFVTTTLDCTEDNCLEEEKNRGLLIADVCRCLGIQHVIYCSQLNSFSIKGIMVRHMVAKAEVEEYMRTIGLPITCLILPMFYEEFCGVLRPRSYDGNIFELGESFAITDYFYSRINENLMAFSNVSF